MCRSGRTWKKILSENLGFKCYCFSWRIAWCGLPSTSEHTQSHSISCNYLFNEVPEVLVGTNTEKPSFYCYCMQTGVVLTTRFVKDNFSKVLNFSAWSKCHMRAENQATFQRLDLFKRIISITVYWELQTKRSWTHKTIIFTPLLHDM